MLTKLMNRSFLLALLTCCATVAHAQETPVPVDRSVYRDYTPAPAADSRLMTAATATTLPSHVNNATAKWFPPIFNQTGGSCGVSSRVGYMMTYEWNAFRLSDASLAANRLVLIPRASTAVYDLQGRRVTTPHLPRGIYIRNGHKWVVK